MKREVIAIAVGVALVLAGCASSGTTTGPATTSAPATGVATTTAPAPTKPPVETPKYGGTLNLVLIADISDWSQGLTFC